MYDDSLKTAAASLAAVTEGLTDELLGSEWVWRDHSEGLRFGLIGTYHELRDLAAVLRQDQNRQESAISYAQYLLGQYHSSYRDLQSVLLGVPDDALDRPPAKDEWPLRRILRHIIGADSLFYVLTHYAVEWSRAGQEPRKITGDDADELVGLEEPFIQLMADEGLEGIQGYYESMHNQIILEASGWTEADLNALSPFWEEKPMPVHYRLHRFDAHLIQHTVQVEKTLEAIGQGPNEAKRLLRRVYNALAEAENAMIGSWDLKSERQRDVAAQIVARAEEIHTITASL